MTARYDSEAHSLAIGLVPRTDHESTAEVAPNTIVGLRDGSPVTIEVIRLDLVGLAGLDAAASRYGLDPVPLRAAAEAAVVAADRDVTVDVGAVG